MAVAKTLALVDLATITVIKCLLVQATKRGGGLSTICTKRLQVTIRSSLLLMMIYNCIKHYNYLQAHLHEIQTYTKIHKHIYKYKSC
jgi:hypothetical protein